MKKKTYLLIPIILVLILAFLGLGYRSWNAASPDKTCVNCHEISPSVQNWHNSAHREIGCLQCHGTALSNGIHSLKEKSNMVFAHMKDEVENNQIHLSEAQVLETMERCVKCHRSEAAKWQMGGHSATYERIFLDSVHNKMESPYWDCLRCHGMHYGGNIQNLLQKVEGESSTWEFKDSSIAQLPSITCLACHEMHSDNVPLRQMESSEQRNPTVSWYIRTDKRHRRADQLFPIEMNDQDSVLLVSDDPIQRLCQQCHSPNSSHQAGSSDDRTPSGVHEGLSCTACHEAHSNDAENSCVKCHPAISNCKLDVRQMNTSYKNVNSPHNIHFVGCADCHID